MFVTAQATLILRARCGRVGRRRRSYPPHIKGGNSVEGTGYTLQARRSRRGDSTAQRAEDRDNEEHCALHTLDERSDENAQVDVTLLTVGYTTETPSVPAHPALAPESNVAVRVLNNETGVQERREFALLPLQIALHQATQEITQHGNGQAR